jgi:DNA-binding PadR family transcriptional regulator
LSDKELIEVHDVEREGNRPERTIYRITATGRAALARSLEQLLEGHPTEYPQLYLALSEAHGLPRSRVIELLTTRLTQMCAELENLRVGAAEAADSGKAEMFYLDIGCRITTLSAQIDWLRGLLERLTNHSIAWLDDPDFRAAASTAPHEKDADA